MRINKLFSNYGICSRKETNKLIEEARIKVNGKNCVLGQWVEESDEILLDDKPILRREKVYIALNKPVDIMCTAEKVQGNIIDFMNYPEYIFPVGRLDKESQGLIIMTNDGELANVILEADNMHEKEYLVQVDRSFDEKFLEVMASGVEIAGEQSSGVKRISDTLGIYKNSKEFSSRKSRIKDCETVPLKELSIIKEDKKTKIMTRACKVNRVNKDTFKIVLTQGLNRQIRKMCGALGYKVIKLERIRIMNITIDNIEIGKWRYLKKDELVRLKSEFKVIGE
ncbi:pseudouridine synthase [Clostridium sp. BL-8]|uniref:pseudouridine synthase n=1 Tax=Clostridium sp. BL-8 TaxID=349938 RepID=UPI00098CCEB5|nr:pseudouridine synthase [Clostridium sp. BL-8]OOM78441.1 ribosomal large subunit pseudouridine synthase F [Clostridium sp. BL-8]